MGLIQRRGGNSKDCLCDALENDGISVYHFSLPAILIWVKEYDTMQT